MAGGTTGFFYWTKLLSYCTIHIVQNRGRNTLGTQNGVEWERMQEKHAHEKILEEAKRAESIKKAQEETNAASQREFEREVRQLRAMSDIRLLTPQKHFVLFLKALKKWKEEIEWGHSLDHVLEKLFK